MIHPQQNTVIKSSEEVLGGVRVDRMIWGATVLTLGALYICLFTTEVENPTILESALEYPYTIIFRVGMLYSMFIFFLEFMFIKWWLDSSQLAHHTKKIAAFGTLGLLSYALFVACIDRKRINFPLAKQAVFYSSIFISLAIYLTMHQITKIKSQSPVFIGETSYLFKQLACTFQGIGMFFGVLIYLGEFDIEYKNYVEYEVVTTSVLFLWTFVYDFKKFKMDIDRLGTESQARSRECQYSQQIAYQMQGQQPQQSQQVYVEDPSYYANRKVNAPMDQEYPRGVPMMPINASPYHGYSQQRLHAVRNPLLE